MVYKRVVLAVVSLVTLSLGGICGARQFSIVGPRALGMGGAYVAACRDASAMYWNPAALALGNEWQAQFAVGGTSQLPDGLLGAIADACEYDYRQSDVANNDEAVRKLRSLLEKMDEAKLGALADSHTGLFLKLKYFGLCFSNVAVAGLLPSVDLENVNTGYSKPNSIADNETQVKALAIEPTDVALTYARSVIPGGELDLGPFTADLLLGASAKLVSARTYYLEKDLWDYGLEGDTLSDVLNEFKRKNSFEATKFSADLGALLTLGDQLSVGLTARNVTEPEFLYGLNGQEEGKVQLDAQYRLGVAVRPFKRWLIATDCDLVKNDTGIEGYSYQTLSVGTEVGFMDGAFALRAGLFDNLVESGSPFITAGFGFDLKYVTFDLAGGVGTSNDDEYAFSTALGVKI